MLVLALVLVAAPPLAPGMHRCGVQWSNYSEVCTVTVDGDTVTITSGGPSAKLDGKLVPIDDKSFTLEGELKVVGTPVGYGSLTTCDEKGPYRFRQTGKRKFFRHTQTCPDMTTSYFDVFIDTITGPATETTKKLSALMGKSVHDSRGQGCAPLSPQLISETKDPTCVRWNESGLGTPYFECPITGAAGRLYVFDKPKACEEIADRLNNP